MFKQFKLLTLILIIFISACKKSEPKLESAFGIKFGVDIEAVRNELIKLGEIKDDGSIIDTKRVIEQNPLFDNYSIFYADNTIYWILASTGKDLKEEQSNKYSQNYIVV